MKLVTIAAILTSITVLSACSERNSETIAQNAAIASLNLSLDEQRVWETMTDAQKARAIAFIQNGGSLFASLGDK